MPGRLHWSNALDAGERCVQQLFCFASDPPPWLCNSPRSLTQLLNSALFPLDNFFVAQFNEKALAKHAGICKKVFQTKRKKFDALEKRWEGAKGLEGDTAAIRENLQKVKREERMKKPAPKKSQKWKQQSSALRDAMQYNRKCADADKKGLPPPQNMAAPVEDDRKPCPHCGRSFNPEVAERHIPKCAETKNKVRSRQLNPAALLVSHALPPHLLDTGEASPERQRPLNQFHCAGIHGLCAPWTQQRPRAWGRRQGVGAG